jgi:hypothetical protein
MITHLQRIYRASIVRLSRVCGASSNPKREQSEINACRTDILPVQAGRLPYGFLLFSNSRRIAAQHIDALTS